MVFPKKIHHDCGKDFKNTKQFQNHTVSSKWGLTNWKNEQNNYKYAKNNI